MSDIELIKSKLNIVDVVKEYIPELKKVGRNWSARSPFRSEKTPSFMVNEELGIFKDFGGDKAGDVIKFIQEIEHTDFRGALEIAAKKAQVELTNTNPQDDAFSKKREEILKVNKFATDLYNYILTSTEFGKTALKYCENRGINSEIIKKYKIGYAPKFLNLQNYISKKLPEVKLELAETGLFTFKNNSWFDKFNDRLMFPIFDNLGQVIGFSGRVINKLDERPKYINSPETLVFKKSNSIFNLFQAKNSISKLDSVIITEGQIDAIMSSFSGVENIVAPLGTALTIEQLKLLSRYTKNIIFCLDNDEAGQKAMERDYELCIQLDLRVKVIQIPTEFKDIDELIQKDKSKWIEVSTSQVDFLDFQIQQKQVNLNLTSAYDAVNYRNSIFKFLTLLKDKTLISKYLQSLAEKLNQNFDEILFEFQKYSSKNSKLSKYSDSQAQNVVADSNIENSEISQTKILDMKEIYLVLLSHNFPELDLSQFASYFQTISTDYSELTKILKLESYKSVAEKVAFLETPNDINVAKADFARILNEIKINSKRRRLHELANNLENSTASDSSHDLKQIDNIILN